MPTSSFSARPLPRLIAVIGVLMICLGSSSRSCSFLGGSSDDDDDDGNGGNDEPSFVTTLELRNSEGEIADRFERGEQIQMILSVRNRLDSSPVIEFPTTRMSDFVVVRENSDDIVWQWSEDETFSEVTSELTFTAGETKTFTEIWDQEDDGDTQVRAETYEARGVLVYDGFDSNPLRSNQQGSTLVRFTID
jgi:hypothetical protein